MIAVDTSVLIAIAKEEPERKRFGSLLAEGDAVIGAPMIVETKLVLSSILDAHDIDEMTRRLVREGSLRIIDFTGDMADAAVEAFRRYGKGQGHPAQLNFGDCLSYAVAKTLDVPLLYKGDHFAHTDIRSALA
ncbi:PIN domain-containing protein [Enterovirga aerilata]|uniref:Ribonuclease VapC n=1 Tax=Enterovirga aerilata TaxID=2730920 RepID=A0A849HUV7_9HYPH|nr:type II toxin-antitoxin system VapC family toxin [Enterovirga sp. DB1703]